MATRRMPEDRVAAPTVALVHDWLTGMRGGERCLEVFCELFPSADLFTLLQVPGSVSPVIEQRRVVTKIDCHPIEPGTDPDDLPGRTERVERRGLVARHAAAQDLDLPQ